MNRFACPNGFEDALLRRAEQHECRHELRQAERCRRLAWSAGKVGNSYVRKPDTERNCVESPSGPQPYRT